MPRLLAALAVVAVLLLAADRTERDDGEAPDYAEEHVA